MCSACTFSLNGQWMMEGANNFNTGVMKDGIGTACSYALTVRAKAEAMK